ncbi:hypothetical protein [Streptomyces sp. NPDC094472]|uniref:hypothetical protein n=1 Tax=unclassified Streptomyces TaxID=2593676 RepID=UPI003332BB38
MWARTGAASAISDTQLRDVLQAAMNAVIKRGEYEKILEKWGARNAAVKESALNGGR